MLSARSYVQNNKSVRDSNIRRENYAFVFPTTETKIENSEPTSNAKTVYSTPPVGTESNVWRERPLQNQVITGRMTNGDNLLEIFKQSPEKRFQISQRNSGPRSRLADVCGLELMRARPREQYRKQLPRAHPVPMLGDIDRMNFEHKNEELRETLPPKTERQRKCILSREPEFFLTSEKEAEIIESGNSFKIRKARIWDMPDVPLAKHNPDKQYAQEFNEAELSYTPTPLFKTREKEEAEVNHRKLPILRAVETEPVLSQNNLNGHVSENREFLRANQQLPQEVTGIQAKNHPTTVREGLRFGDKKSLTILEESTEAYHGGIGHSDMKGISVTKLPIARNAVVVHEEHPEVTGTLPSREARVTKIRLKPFDKAPLDMEASSVEEEKREQAQEKVRQFDKNISGVDDITVLSKTNNVGDRMIYQFLKEDRKLDSKERDVLHLEHLQNHQPRFVQDVGNGGVRVGERGVSQSQNDHAENPYIPQGSTTTRQLTRAGARETERAEKSFFETDALVKPNREMLREFTIVPKGSRTTAEPNPVEFETARNNNFKMSRENHVITNKQGRKTSVHNEVDTKDFIAANAREAGKPWVITHKKRNVPTSHGFQEMINTPIATIPFDDLKTIRQDAGVDQKKNLKRYTLDQPIRRNNAVEKQREVPAMHENTNVGKETIIGPIRKKPTTQRKFDESVPTLVY